MWTGKTVGRRAEKEGMDSNPSIGYLSVLADRRSTGASINVSTGTAAITEILISVLLLIQSSLYIQSRPRQTSNPTPPGA
jgi:hypothetical protein